MDICLSESGTDFARKIESESLPAIILDLQKIDQFALFRAGIRAASLNNAILTNRFQMNRFATSYRTALPVRTPAAVWDGLSADLKLDGINFGGTARIRIQPIRIVGLILVVTLLIDLIIIIG